MSDSNGDKAPRLKPDTSRIIGPDLLERYRRLLKISRDLASTLDLEGLLNRIIQAAADLCGAEAASILLYDELKGELHFDSATNLSEPLMRGLVVPVENSLAGWIVKNRQPILILDTQNDARHFDQVGQATRITTTSLLGAPLIARDKVVGVLEVINKLSGEFDLEDQDLLMALGAQAAVAIENTHLFQQSDLISELVHELRTPLTSLNTAARLMQRSPLDEETRQKMLAVLQDETGRLCDLTSAYLDLARLESGRAQFQIQRFDLNPLLEECAGLMLPKAQERGVSILLDVSKPIPDVKADRAKIKQVILNLLSNAIKYNRPNGSVCLSARAAEAEIQVDVTDTGAGIAPEHLQHLFTKFYRVPGSSRLAAGTGLGLSICKRIIAAHGGQISARSQVGEGTVVEVRLPLKQANSYKL